VKSTVQLRGHFEVRSIDKFNGKSVVITWGAAYPINPTEKVADLKHQLLTNGDPDYSIRGDIGAIENISSLNSGVEEVRVGKAICRTNYLGSKNNVLLSGVPEVYPDYVYQSALPVKGVLIKYDPKCPFCIN
jgi:hypothetical protein